jgi:hypothetical protein
MVARHVNECARMRYKLGSRGPPDQPERVLQVVWRAPIARRKCDAPEVRRGRVEFKRNVKAFGHLSSGACNTAGYFLICALVLEHDTRFHRQTLAHYNERATIGHAKCGGFNSGELAFKSDMDIGAHAQEHALAAFPLLSHDTG